jgi:hypothetical protein
MKETNETVVIIKAAHGGRTGGGLFDRLLPSRR